MKSNLIKNDDEDIETSLKLRANQIEKNKTHVSGPIPVFAELSENALPLSKCFVFSFSLVSAEVFVRKRSETRRQLDVAL